MTVYDAREQEFVDEILDMMPVVEDVADTIKDYFPRLSMKKCERQAEWYVSRIMRINDYASREQAFEQEYKCATALYRALCK